MHYDMQSLPSRKRYKLLSSLVVPRPIAWVSTRSADNVMNLAPFSFFNVMGHDPAILALGVMAHPDKGVKDTARNIELNGRFTVSLVTEDLADRMNATAEDLPYGVSEAVTGGVDLCETAANGIPGVADSPVRMACALLTSVPTGTRQRLILGTILSIEIKDSLLKDPDAAAVCLEAYAPIARMGGAGIYCRTKDRFERARPDRKTQPLD